MKRRKSAVRIMEMLLLKWVQGGYPAANYNSLLNRKPADKNSLEIIRLCN